MGKLPLDKIHFITRDLNQNANTKATEKESPKTQGSRVSAWESTGLGLRPTSNCFAIPSLKVMENNARHVFLFKMWAQIQGEKKWGGRGSRQVCLGLCPPDKHAFQDFRPNKERHLCLRQSAEQTHPASFSLPPWSLGWSSDHTRTFIIPATIWARVGTSSRDHSRSV